MDKYSFKSQYEWSHFDFMVILAKIMKLTRKRGKKLFISADGKKFLADTPDNQHASMFFHYYNYFNWCYLFPYTETEEENPARHLQEAKDIFLREILDYPVDPDNFIDFKSFASHIRGKFHLMLNYRNEPLPKRVDDCIEQVLLDFLMDFGFLEYHMYQEEDAMYAFEYMDKFKITSMGKAALSALVK